MPLFQWSDDYSVAVAKFDHQHKKLIDIINELHDAMKAGKGNQILGNIVAKLVDYTKTHFTEEEALMQQYKYPGLAIQKTQHDAFVKELQKIQKNLESSTVSVTLDVMNFLKSWLVNHIQKTDKSYASFFNAKGVK